MKTETELLKAQDRLIKLLESETTRENYTYKALEQENLHKLIASLTSQIAEAEKEVIPNPRTTEHPESFRVDNFNQKQMIKDADDTIKAVKNQHEQPETASAEEDESHYDAEVVLSDIEFKHRNDVCNSFNYKKIVIEAMEEYAEIVSNRVRILYEKPSKKLEPLQDYYRAEHPLPNNEFYIPDATKLYEWIASTFIKLKAQEGQRGGLSEKSIDLMQYVTNLLYAVYEKENNTLPHEFDEYVDREIKNIGEFLQEGQKPSDEAIINYALNYVCHKDLHPANRGLIKDAVIIGAKAMRDGKIKSNQ